MLRLPKLKTTRATQTVSDLQQSSGPLFDRIYMNNLLSIPIVAVTALTSERAVVVIRAIFRSECDYAKLSPTVLTISSRLTIADGGIDAEVNVNQHMALFSRFGYETPVGDEAAYIAKLIQKVDPTIGWARFQEIVQGLRAKKVLQGSRTLFFVPKALHIYLWKQFWERYGRGFDFTQTFKDMPESLHAWFMNMFKFAGDTTAHVIEDILRPDGYFSERAALTSAKGSRFLSILNRPGFRGGHLV